MERTFQDPPDRAEPEAVHNKKTAEPDPKAKNHGNSAQSLDEQIEIWSSIVHKSNNKK